MTREIFVNQDQVEQSKALLGKEAVEMLLQVHQDALWILENLGGLAPKTEEPKTEGGDIEL